MDKADVVCNGDEYEIHCFDNNRLKIVLVGDRANTEEPRGTRVGSYFPLIYGTKGGDFGVVMSYFILKADFPKTKDGDEQLSKAEVDFLAELGAKGATRTSAIHHERKFIWNDGGANTTKTHVVIAADFIAKLQEKFPNRYILPFFDNVSLHRSEEVLALWRAAQATPPKGTTTVLDICFLPPNTTHWLQVLDGELFARLRTAADEFVAKHKSMHAITGSLTRDSLKLICLAGVLETEGSVFKPDKIKAAFAARCILPWNPTAMLALAGVNSQQAKQMLKARTKEEAIVREAVAATAAVLKAANAEKLDVTKKTTLTIIKNRAYTLEAIKTVAQQQEQEKEQEQKKKKENQEKEREEKQKKKDDQEKRKADEVEAAAAKAAAKVRAISIQLID